ncbi:MAG TPA: glycosyltransferase family 2 protein [Candidatus Saccharimonadales bacterium]|nr:glycosyltransferase family 2 protein [Candidatus Saccharimonadales bacterium]
MTPVENPEIDTKREDAPGSLDVSIIIVNWKSTEYVKKCLESVYQFTKDLRFEVIVIDSASYDGCGEMLARDFSGVIFIQSSENLGFAKANNAAVQHAHADVFLFLNPDTELISPAINLLYDQVNQLPSVGAVGAKLLNADRTLQISCVQSIPTILNQTLDADLLRSVFPRAALWGMAALWAEPEKEAEVESISGACIMAKREAFEKAGRFSSDYFMYCEDTELCYKISASGYKIYYIPQAALIHYGGGSSQQSRGQFSNVMMRDSISRFFTKTRGRWYSTAYRALMMVSALCRLAIVVLSFPFQCVRGKLKCSQQAFAKWKAIFLWSLGAQTWIRQYK